MKGGQKENCDNIKRRSSPRKKRGLEDVSSQDQGHSSLPLQEDDSIKCHDSDPELPAPVPVLPPRPVTDSNNLKVNPLTSKNEPPIGLTDLVLEASVTDDASKEENSENSEEHEAPSDLFAVGQNAGKAGGGGRKKLNRISVDRLEVPPTPPRRSSRRRPPSESSRARKQSPGQSVSPSKSPSKRKAKGETRKSGRLEDDDDDDDDEPSALHPAQLPLPIVESPPQDKPLPSSLTPPETNLPPSEQQCPPEKPPGGPTCSNEKAAPLKISLASGFNALSQKVGPGPAPVQHSDLEPYVESEEEREKRERKKMEDKKFLEEEKRRLEEEKRILKEKVLEKRRREEQKEAKKQESEKVAQAEIAPTRKGAADFFDIIMDEASEDLKQADIESSKGKSAKDETRTVKLVVEGAYAAKELGEGDTEKVTEQRRIKRISLDKVEEELKCALCTPEKKCSVCELQKSPSLPSSRAEKVLRQEKSWRRERSGEREQDEKQMRREEREVRRRWQM